MDDFLESVKSVVGAALEYGVRYVPITPARDKSPFRDFRHQRDFFASCHRGYEKAQTRILELVRTLHSNPMLTDDEKLYRELIYRRVVDAIAFTILRTESHVARRLELHDVPPNLDFTTMTAAKREVDRLNDESRLTFALLADLTTFIHVADVLRVDFRSGVPSVHLVELKSGRVNNLLLSQLEMYNQSQSQSKR